ncbi:MAG: XTP/dITP diphosphatase [Elusimicrobiota bacterium]|jgi:XTP/dITP diphosphohydrolase|nr:XTP/dITP diphosphatase [Elusimicrobiota bacterium]
MKEIILATANAHKVLEIKEILKGMDLSIKSLADFKDYPKVVEDGATLCENSVKKALTIAQFFNKPTISDDTGLEVEYLNGAPGVFSARFAGPQCIDKNNRLKLLKELNNVPFEKRAAHFKCAVSIVFPDRNMMIKTVEGQIDGYISLEESGQNGFGYDSLFWLAQYKKTFAELDAELKNKISHRAKALEKAKAIIAEFL